MRPTTIQLPTLDLLRSMIRYDAETGDVWWIRPGNGRNLAAPLRNPDIGGYYRIKINNVRYQLHRIIFYLHHGRDPICYVDHIDGDKTNNRIENLRDASQSQNMQNSKKPITNKSGVKGVHWKKSENKWRARIGASGKRIELGLFRDIKDATAAVIAARARLHQEFCNHG